MTEDGMLLANISVRVYTVGDANERSRSDVEYALAGIEVMGKVLK